MRFLPLVICSLVALGSLSAAGSVSAQADRNCADFGSQAHAQISLDIGNVNNVDDIDPDGDEIACEIYDYRTGAYIEPPAPGNTPAQPASEDQQLGTDEITNQEQAYFDALGDDTELSGQVAMEVGALFTEAGQDPTLIFDQEWIIDLVAQLVQWEFIAEDAEDLEPSSRQQHIHDLWLEINRLILLAVDDIIFGVDNIDPATLEAGTDRIIYASLLTDDLTAAILAFADDPNTPVEPVNPIAPVLDCEPFPDYETAQLYYAANPDEQLTIDPDLDGFACEVFFDRE